MPPAEGPLPAGFFAVPAGYTQKEASAFEEKELNLASADKEQ